MVRGPIEWLPVRETRTRRLNSSPDLDDRRGYSSASLLGPILRECQVSLEACPACGYALSTLGNHCRHCHPSLTAPASLRPFDAKLVAQIVGGVLVLGVLVYLIFFR